MSQEGDLAWNITSLVIFITMDGRTLREARRLRRWTQANLAQHLGLSQTYVSLLESGRRRVPGHLAGKLVADLDLPPTHVPMTNKTAPLPSDAAGRALASLGYPGFAHLKRTRTVNPAELVFRTLSSRDVEARLVEALPWVLLQYRDLNWVWLVKQAKLNDLQNRLGFVVTLARELAERQANTKAADTLAHWEQRLTHSRLQREDAFTSETMTERERQWLKVHRSAEAAQWNLLSNTGIEAITSA